MEKSFITLRHALFYLCILVAYNQGRKSCVFCFNTLNDKVEDYYCFVMVRSFFLCVLVIINPYTPHASPLLP